MTAAVPTVAIKAAMSVARDLAEGRLSAGQLDDAVTTLCRELFATVAGPDDPLWGLQVEVARGILALRGIPVDEQAEWLAVNRAAEGVEAVAAEPSWIEQALAQMADEGDDEDGVTSDDV
jgi:hypothetical protein